MGAVIGRFAPSPSGRMHLGNVFSALIAWSAAKSEGGKIVLRIEDLDPRAQNPHTASLLMEDLQWLGLTWDAGPFFQSDRKELYLDALTKLKSKDLLYPCFCSRADLHAATAPHASDQIHPYPGTCRSLSKAERKNRLLHKAAATRLKVPPSDNPTSFIAFTDLVYGAYRENLACTCGDFLVQRSDNVIAYQLAVTVDDADMGITQVVRGCDLLSSTARQIYLQHLLGYKTPTYAHVPLLVDGSGRRLSKRDKDLDLGSFKAHGISAEQLIGFLASLIGLAEPQEELSAPEVARRFSWNTLRNHRENVNIRNIFPLGPFSEL